jgi:hypothetical protein
MMNDYAEKLYGELREELELYADMGISAVKRVTGMIGCIQAAFRKLKAYLLEHPFETPEAEIYFFKQVKPKFIAEQVYAMELFTIEVSRPVGDEEMLKEFYKLELRYIERFLYQYRSLYQYFQYEETAFDRVYFLRGGQKSLLPIPDLLEPDPDPSFSTGCDYLFGRFIAVERLQLEILKRMNGGGGSAVPVKPKPFLKWTGSQVNLVELVYGLYYTGQINNGDVDITELVELMETMFRFKLRDAHHSFIEIRRRKVISPARFIEQMAAAIRQRVDDDLEYKPKKMTDRR